MKRRNYKSGPDPARDLPGFGTFIRENTVRTVIPAGMLECPECHAAQEVKVGDLWLPCRTCAGQGWITP